MSRSKVKDIELERLLFTPQVNCQIIDDVKEWGDLGYVASQVEPYSFPGQVVLFKPQTEVLTIAAHAARVCYLYVAGEEGGQWIALAKGSKLLYRLEGLPCQAG